MIQFRRRFGFHLKAIQEIRGKVVPGDELEGDHPVEAELPRAINDTHPAARNLLDQFKVTKAPLSLRFPDNLRFRFEKTIAQAARTKPVRASRRKRSAASWANR